MHTNQAGRVLLVEDEATLRDLVAEFLRGEGFQIVEAADGLQAIERFSRLGPFGLVLLDLNLPFLPGIEVCRQIKEREPYQPILICSAAILDDHQAALQRYGVDQFLSKPYHPADLLVRMALEMDRPTHRGDSSSRLAPGPGPWREHGAHVGSAAASHALFKGCVIDYPGKSV